VFGKERSSAEAASIEDHADPLFPAPDDVAGQVQPVGPEYQRKFIGDAHGAGHLERRPDIRHVANHGKKQKNVLRHELFAKGDQYVFIGMAGTQKAIIGWRVGKRNTETTLEFLSDLRGRVIGQPEISTDGFHPYRMAIRDAFGDSASHGVIVKTYSVTHLVKEAQGRYSPAAVVAVSKEVVTGDPDQYISTSYVERQNLSLRMGQRRFTRLTNGFSKKLDNHVAAVALYVAHYNLCRVHEALKTTPAKALGVADRAWTIGNLIDAALATQSITPVPTAPARRRGFTVIDGGKG
jgi:IS1 family transposase